MKFLHVLVLGCVCALPLAASAQWQWIDNSGKKVFSDQPPPSDIPEKNIVRRNGPNPAQRVNVVPTTDAPAADSAPAASAAPKAPKPSGVDKELEEKTKKAEADEKAKQAAEADKIAKAKADNCARAREGKNTLDSGIRIAKVNSSGEREILDDTGRAAEQKRIQSTIDANCK